MPADDVRPRTGTLRRADGTELELRFVKTDEPGRFLAVTVDGDEPVMTRQDQVSVDVIGPGQSVVLRLPP